MKSNIHILYIYPHIIEIQFTEVSCRLFYKWFHFVKFNQNLVHMCLILFKHKNETSKNKRKEEKEKEMQTGKRDNFMGD